MNPIHCLKTSLAIAALLALPMAHAATMSEADHGAAKSRISEQYKADDARCNSLAGNTKDVCVQEAKAREKVSYAELQYSYSGAPADQTKVRVAKAESAYAVAKEKCDDMAGNTKDVCVKEAKAIETKALADAKLGKEIGAAQREATDDKTSADYSVAKEKCDVMAGDAKTACVDAAKAKYGKS